MKYLICIFALIAITAQPLAAQQNPTLVGDWKGTINIQGTHLIIKAHFTQADSGFDGTLDIPQQGGKGLELYKIKQTNTDSLSWYQDTGGNGVAKYKGHFKTNTTITGTFHQHNRQFQFELKRYNPQTTPQNSTHRTSVDSSKIAHDSTLAGSWKGTFSDSTSFKTQFKYQKKSYSGTVKFQVYQLPLQHIYTTKDDSVFFYFPLNGGGQFKGFFQRDSLITGDYYQNGHHLQFEMKRYKRAHKIKKPYHHQDIIIKNDSIKISGTLTWPRNGISDQLVIMISGSGAQNRDEEALGFKIFGQISDYLTRHGVATYRYDDRGVDESTGNFNQATLDVLASDTKSIVAHFSKQSDHHFKNIILFGHSQGGIVAGKVAAQDTLVDKIVLMSSPSIMLHKVLNYQFERIFRKLQFKGNQIKKTLSAFQKVLEATRENDGITEAKNNFHKQFAEMVKTAPDSIQKNEHEIIDKLDTQMAQAFTTPQMQSLMFYKPANDLRKLDVPVLATFGGNDLKVLIRKNRPPMQSALDSAGVSYQINVFKYANHMYVKRGGKQTLSEERYSFIKDFLPTITQWIKNP